jgi:SAM-dependent methyltransferase
MDDSGLDYHPLSWTDPVGRLFRRDGRLYRGIRPARADLYRDLLRRGIIQALIDKHLLIDTKAAAWSTPEFPLVLEHRALPVVSYPAEWSAAQFKDAALLVLDLEAALRPHGLTLHDANPWNVLFDGTQPLFVDFSCIAPLEDRSLWYGRRELVEFYLNPLLLMEMGSARVARRMLFDPWVGVTNDELGRLGLPHRRWKTITAAAKTLIKSVTPASLHPSMKSAARVIAPGDPIKDIAALRRQVSEFQAVKVRTDWSDYYGERFPDFVLSSDWTAKHRAIHKILTDAKPATVLDFGANRGWYAQLAARNGARVIAADNDEASLNALYAEVKAAGLAVLPAFMDMRFPEPAQGPGYQFFAPATERFKSDMVLALALVHHLVFTWNLSFDHIAEGLGAFAREWLVVEFVGPGDGVVQRWPQANYSWYRLENFTAALARKFDVVEKLPSDAGGIDDVVADRAILLCRRKSH